MKRRIVCTVAAALLLSGCLLESVGRVNRNDKPYGAQWVKEGVTKEKWLADWVQCGGGGTETMGMKGKGNHTKSLLKV